MQPDEEDKNIPQIKNRRKILLIFISAALLMVLVGSLIFYFTDWFDALRKQLGIISGLEFEKQFGNASKEECLEAMGKMSDEELVVEVIKSGNNDLREEMMTYLLCKTGNDLSEKRGENYEKARGFIERMYNKSTDSDRREKVLSWLSGGYNNLFILMLALGDLNMLCPNELPEICSKENNDIDSRYVGLFGNNPYFSSMKEWCDNICGTLNSRINSPDSFDRLMKSSPFKQDDKEYLKMQYYWRAAVAYRVGNQAYALTAPCDSLNDIEARNNCIDLINRFKKIEEGSICTEAQENFKNTSCQTF